MCGNWLENHFKQTPPRESHRLIFMQSPGGKVLDPFFFLSFSNSVLQKEQLIKSLRSLRFSFFHLKLLPEIPYPFKYYSLEYRGDLISERVLQEMPLPLVETPIKKYLYWNDQGDRSTWSDIRSGKTLLHQSIPEDILEVLIRTSQAGLTVSLLSQEQTYGQAFTGSGLTAKNGFGCFFDYLFQPKPELFLPIYSTFMEVTRGSRIDKEKEGKKILKIGIHFDFGGGDDYLNHIFDCAQQIEAHVLHRQSSVYSKAQWVVLSQDLKTLDGIEQKYGSDKIIPTLSGKEGPESSNNNGDDDISIAEWFTFSLVDYFVIPMDRFGLSSAFRTGYRNNAFKINEDPSVPARCSPESDFLSIDELAKYDRGL
jgi:hypothetical protein